MLAEAMPTIAAACVNNHDRGGRTAGLSQSQRDKRLWAGLDYNAATPSLPCNPKASTSGELFNPWQYQKGRDKLAACPCACEELFTRIRQRSHPVTIDEANAYRLRADKASETRDQICTS